MPTKWQKTKIEIPKGYTPIERKAIAQDIIDFIIERTSEKRLDRKNKKFKPGYSKAYAESREGQVGGKAKGQTPNLELSGEMLNNLGEYRKDSNGKIVIGYKNGSKSNAKADGNIRGTYGQPRPIIDKKTKKPIARDFLGITKTDLNKILKSYPINKKDGEKDIFINILLNSEATGVKTKAQARAIAARYGIEGEDFEEAYAKTQG